MRYATQLQGRTDETMRLAAFAAAIGVALLFCTAGLARAATYFVFSPGDAGAGAGDIGDFRWAIGQANANPGSTIELHSSVTLLSPLPFLTASVTITGYSNATVSGNDQFRIFFVDAPDATVNLNTLTLAHGYAKGGAGGTRAGGGMGAGAAMFVNAGNVTLDGVNFSSNTVVGGDGGDGVPANSGQTWGGGGGGLGGNGGLSSGDAGGGGGGFGGNGGTDGGGGGGLIGHGGNGTAFTGGGGGGLTDGQNATLNEGGAPGTGGGVGGTRPAAGNGGGGSGTLYGGGGGSAVPSTMGNQTFGGHGGAFGGGGRSS